MHSSRTVTTTLIAIGASLAVIGLVAPHVITSKVFWGDRQAQEYREAADELHAATSDPNLTQNNERAQNRLEAARQRFQTAQSKLDIARVRRSYTGRYLMTLGLVLLLAGGLFDMSRRAG